jgi:hypothetical protein
MTDLATLEARIDESFESGETDAAAVEAAIDLLDRGELRLAEPGGDPAESIRLQILGLPELRAAARRGDLPTQTSLACLFLGLERLRELGLG